MKTSKRILEKLAEHYVLKFAKETGREPSEYRGKIWVGWDEERQQYELRGEGLPAHPDMATQYPNGWSLLDSIPPDKANEILGLPKLRATNKRILKVVVKRMLDDSPDTSYLGEYSNRPESEYAIDRAHSEDCASVTPETLKAKETLEHAQQTVGDIYNAVLAQYNGTLANETLDNERDALDEAYDMLGELAEEVTECDCGKRGDMGRNEYRYFNGSVENYEGDTPENIRKYVRQDYERMESLNAGHWCYIGIRAEAEIALEGTEPSRRYYFEGWTMQTIKSGGLWGIESDSGEDYLQSVAKEELADLRGQLKVLGFSSRAISAAFKNVEEVND